MQSQRITTAEVTPDHIARQVAEASLMELAAEIDLVEEYSAPHGTFIARMAESLGSHFGLRDSDLSALKQAGLAHDLGERVMKREYFGRRGELTWDERFDLWRHPILGEQAAAQRGLPRQAQLLIRWHHEWWNGRGYPDNLAGEAIPLGARILRVVDTYSALISDRPYRERFDEATARQIIADRAGIEFDPQVVKAFLEIVNSQR
ncbi:MAG TPA: HD domain-containing phosphohydrolase [Blastocatellia bacterium]|nr:HD domain-containing phosphohydrolase [Blastocatellia bacterium]